MDVPDDVLGVDNQSLNESMISEAKDISYENFLTMYLDHIGELLLS